ncbi:hypothetical protein BJ912DRAFT_644171 [Pholiota molesta]|nr:hypothetical protein BJ912DRAFT_644171 [Pholiota molesta]
MVFGFLQNIICCYRHIPPAIDGPYDETSHLIPHIIEPTDIHSNESLYDRRKLQARLGDIVRAKEGKMVNVASQIPFNLHNRVVPMEKSMSSSHSRSASESGEYDQPYHPSQTYFDVYSNRNSARKRKRHPHTGNPHFYADLAHSGYTWSEAGPSNTARSRSPTTIQPRPTPILNVRLVGYTDIKSRGRTTERGPHPSGSPSLTKTSRSPPQLSTVSLEDKDVARQGTAVADFKLYDIGPIIISWGD